MSRFKALADLIGTSEDLAKHAAQNTRQVNDVVPGNQLMEAINPEIFELKRTFNGNDQIAQYLVTKRAELETALKTPGYPKEKLENLKADIRNTITANSSYDRVPRQEVIRQGDIQVNPQPQANVASQQDNMFKKAAGFGVAPAAGGLQNPIDMLKSGYEKFEGARDKVNDYIVDKTSLTPAGSPAREIEQRQNKALVNQVTDPLNYIGGIGAADAALSAPALVNDLAPEGTKDRFKKLLKD